MQPTIITMRKKKRIKKTKKELNRLRADVFNHLTNVLARKAVIYSLEYDRSLSETELDFFMKHKLYRNDKKKN